MSGQVKLNKFLRGAGYVVFTTTFIFFAPELFAVTSGAQLAKTKLASESYQEEVKKNYPVAIEKMLRLKNLGGVDEYFLELRLGYLFSLSQKTNNSIDHYDRAARLRPSSIEPWLGLSLMYCNLQMWAKAKQASKELLKRDGSNYYGLLRLGLANLQMKDFAGANSSSSEALKFYPTDLSFMSQKLYSLLGMGKSKEAQPFLEKLLVLNPQFELITPSEVE